VGDAIGLSAGLAALVLGFPVLLLAMLALLGWLEAWMLKPDERADEVARLLQGHGEPDEVEAAVTRLFADVSVRRTPSLRRRQRIRRALAARQRRAVRSGSQPGSPAGS
jgi:hypothetical protein